ncbi:MAG: hypothetical protein RLW61_04150 [Gammaproteobacteria bacterium]
MPRFPATRFVARAACLAALAAAAPAVPAALVEIDFDEAGIGPLDVVTDQYAALGVSFGNAPAVVKTGDMFNNAFASDGQLVHVDTFDPVLLIDLAFAADAFSFEFRRPSDAGAIYLRLLDDAGVVLDAGQIGWDPLVTPGWASFDYAGSLGSFTRVELSAPRKFVFDNLRFNRVEPPPAVAVPVPFAAEAALLVLAPFAIGGGGAQWRAVMRTQR